jgi:hypothetical protein
MARVFISHSSRDRELAVLLVDLLSSALDLPAEAIRCTSVEGHRLPGGADVDQTLRNEIRECEAFIGLISQSSMESADVLFELGARWGLGMPLLPLLAPNVEPGVLRGPLSRINALRCSNGVDLHQVVDEVGRLVRLQPGRPVVYQRQIDSILRFSPPVTTADASSATSAQEAGVVFRDRFDDFAGWQQYGQGRVSRSDEITPRSGAFCLRKDSAGDPSGGFRQLPRPVDLGLVFSGWIYSPERRAGGRADRLAVEDRDFDGYGFCVDHGSDAVWIERRDRGRATVIGSRVTFAAPIGEWYRFQFYMKTGGRFQLNLHSRSGDDLLTIPEAVDGRHSSFDRIVVHGGFVYYVDELKLSVSEG